MKCIVKNMIIIVIFILKFTDISNLVSCIVDKINTYNLMSAVDGRFRFTIWIIKVHIYIYINLRYMFISSAIHTNQFKNLIPISTHLRPYEIVHCL